MAELTSPRILVVGTDPALSGRVLALLPANKEVSGIWAPAALERRVGNADDPSVRHVGNGQAALAQIQGALANGWPFAVAFVDRRLPEGADGLMTIHQLWRQQPDLQIVLCRDAADGTWEEITDRLGQTDALAILSSPVDPVALRQLACGATRKWLQARRAGERADELKQAQRQVQALIDYLPSPICLRDLDGRFILTNGAFRQRFATTSEAVFGRRPEEALPATLAWLFTPLDAQAIHGEKPLEYEVIQPAHGDRPATAWLVGKWPLHGADGRPYALCSLFTDLSRRQAEEDQLRQGLAIRSQVRMAAEVGHRFGNLLTLIGGHAEVAQRRLGPGHGAIPALAEVRRAVVQGTDLVRQLSIFGRTGALQLAEVDLRQVVTAQVEVLRSVLPPGVDLRVLLPATPAIARVDAGQFAASLLDVVLEAVGGSGTAGLNLELLTGGVADAPLYEVRIGLVPGSYASGRDPFAGPGDGGHLGLAAARVLCEQLGGSARRCTLPGGGEALVLAVPVAQVPVPPAQPQPSGGGPATILVAEDETLVRELVAEVLKEAGYHVLVARDGHEAQSIAASSTVAIDLLIADSIMPRLDGLALAERVRAGHAAARILVMSGYTESAAVRQGLRRIDAGFLQKPFTIDELLKAVRQQLGAAGSPRTPHTPLRSFAHLGDRPVTIGR